MPIQFQCDHCGKELSVSSKLAGKSGKCPKCQKAIVVPAATGSNAGAESIAPATGQSSAREVAPKRQASDKAKAAAKSANVAASSRSRSASAPKKASGTTPVDAVKMSALLDEMGFVKKSGPTCPSCRADIQPGTVVCTSCGFNLQTEKKVDGFEAKIERPEFDNLYLQLAVDNMSRDKLTDQRREKSAMPWWVLASFLIGIVMLGVAGVILVDANFGEPAPADTRMGRIQRVPVFVILGTTVGVTGLALALFAHLNICIFGFQRKVITGLACFFLPLIFSLPYGIMNWVDNKAPIKGFILAIVVTAAGAGLIIYGGGFGKLNGVL